MVYQCFAIQNPVYGPAMRLIASITNANPAVVTTTFAHGYPNGTVVRFDLPPAVGMGQLNQMTAPLTVTGTTTFTVPINTIPFVPFSIPGSLSPKINICAQCVPLGSENDTLAPAEINLL